LRSLRVRCNSDGQLEISHNCSIHFLVVHTVEGSTLLDGNPPSYLHLGAIRDVSIDVYSVFGFGAARFEIGAGVSSELQAFAVEIVVADASGGMARVPAPPDRPAILLESDANAIDTSSESFATLMWLSCTGREIAEITGPAIVSGVRDPLMIAALAKLVPSGAQCQRGTGPADLDSLDVPELEASELPWRSCGLVVIGANSPFDVATYVAACRDVVPPTLWLRDGGEELAQALGQRARVGMTWIVSGLAPLGWLVVADQTSPMARLLES
jgi:hypothetical protein